MPERIHEMNNFESVALFSVGTHILTHNRAGLKIVPQKQVLFTIDTGETVAKFSAPLSLAKILRDQLSEYIAACEQYDKDSR